MALDILILVILVVAGVMGFAKGVLSQAGQIASVVGGIVAARLFGASLTDILAGADGPTALDTVCGYGVTFLLAYGLVWLVFRLVRGVVHKVHLGIVDRLAGAVFKVLQWALLLSLAVNFYILTAGDDARLHDKSHPWREAVVKVAPATLGYLTELMQADKKSAK